MYLTTSGLVLRVTNYNDNDALLTILTPLHGMLTVKARGLRRKNSPLAASCQLLALSEFTLFENRGFYTINEVQCRELFPELRMDIQKLTLATYFAQVAEVISQEDMPSPDLLSLVLNCIHVLTKRNLSEQVVKAVFELRAVCIAGYMPDLSGCAHCGNIFPDRFDLSEGRLECSACRNNTTNGIRMPISGGVLDAMRYICTCDKQSLFSFQIGEDTENCLSQLSEGYLCTQLERGFSALDFYKSLFIDINY